MWTDGHLSHVMYVGVIMELFSSADDETVRVWSLPNKTHQFLEQTFIFHKSSAASQIDNCAEVDHISSLAWNNSGTFLAATIDKNINVWMSSGKISTLVQAISLYTVLGLIFNQATRILPICNRKS